MVLVDEVGQPLDGAGGCGIGQAQALAVGGQVVAAVVQDVHRPGAPPLLEGHAELLDGGRIEARLGRVLAVSVDGQLLRHLHELVPGPGLGELGRRLGETGGLEGGLVVEEAERLDGGADAVSVVGAVLEPDPVDEVALLEIRILGQHLEPVHELALAAPDRGELGGAVAGVGRVPGRRHGRDLGVEVLLRDVDRLHLHPGLLGEVRAGLLHGELLLRAAPVHVLDGHRVLAGGWAAGLYDSDQEEQHHPSRERAPPPHGSLRT